jgi:hypothetical protein
VGSNPTPSAISQTSKTEGFWVQKRRGNRSTVSESVSEAGAVLGFVRTPAPFGNTSPLLFNGFRFVSWLKRHECKTDS